MSESTTATGTGGAVDPSIAELTALVRELSAQVADLRTRLDAIEGSQEVSEDVVLAISAAVAAYLGKRATVKQVHLRRGGGWATQGRAAVQQSHAVAPVVHR